MHNLYKKKSFRGISQGWLGCHWAFQNSLIPPALLIKDCKLLSCKFSWKPRAGHNWVFKRQNPLGWLYTFSDSVYEFMKGVTGKRLCAHSAKLPSWAGPWKDTKSPRRGAPEAPFKASKISKGGHLINYNVIQTISILVYILPKYFCIVD